MPPLVRRIPLSTEITPVADWTETLALVDELASERQLATGITISSATRHRAARLVCRWVNAALEHDLWPDSYPAHIDIVAVCLDIAGNQPPVPPDLPVLEVGAATYGRDLAARHLGDVQRLPELWGLNRGRPQPDGGSWTNLHGEIPPGWFLRFPPDATGEGLVWGRP